MIRDRDCREKLDAYRGHQDAEAFAALVAQFRPMVQGVCRRYLVASSDLDDAVQETFVKLARKAAAIEGDVGPWLQATAGTTALDFARRSMRRRKLTNTLAKTQGERGAGLPWEVLQPRLDEALRGLDAGTRSLVLARYFEQSAVKQIARAAGVTSSAMTRRVNRAVAKLRAVLQRMGYESMEEVLVGDSPAKEKREVVATGPRSGVFWVPPGEAHGDAARGPRALRIGVFVSQTALTNGNFDGYIAPLERQLELVTHLRADRYRLITLVEPGTEEYPLIERATREFGLTAGMLDASDPEALKLLDVIFLGELQATSGRVLAAVAEAVESGVGLFNGGFVGITMPGFGDARTKRLFLTEHLAMYHSPDYHGKPMPATIQAHHPLLAPLGPGTQMEIYGCGPVFLPDPVRSQVLMTKDMAADNVYPHDPKLLGKRLPVFTVGTLGKGRVVILSVMTPEPLVTHAAYGGRFLTNLIDYLAEPGAFERAALGL